MISGIRIREEKMEFKAAMFAAAVVAVLLSSPSPALAQKKSPPAAPSPVSLPPSLAPAPAPAPHYVDLAELLSVAGPFHTFLNYLEKTNVIETFQSQANKTKEGVTIFVPKDSAFAAIKQSTFSNLTGDQLKTLLLYHAFPKFYSLAEFKNLSELNPVNTFAGAPYTLNLTDDMGTISVQSMWSRPKISSSVYATRPVAVYALNKVLLPMQIFSKDLLLAPAPAPALVSGRLTSRPARRPARRRRRRQGGFDERACGVGAGVVNGLVMALAGSLMLLWWWSERERERVLGVKFATAAHCSCFSTLDSILNWFERAILLDIVGNVCRIELEFFFLQRITIIIHNYSSADGWMNMKRGFSYISTTSLLLLCLTMTFH